MRTLVLGSLVLVGCASSKAAYVPLVSPDRQVETRALPPDAPTEPLPNGTPAGDWVVPVEVGETVKKAGIEVSEARAARDTIYRIRYVELRKLYESDRLIWTAHRALYEKQLENTEAALKAAQPNWFQQHALQLGIIGGFVLGAATTVLLTYAVNQVSMAPASP